MVRTWPEEPIALRTFKKSVVVSSGQRHKAVQDFLFGSGLEVTVAIYATGERAQTSFQIKELEDFQKLIPGLLGPDQTTPYDLAALQQTMVPTQQDTACSLRLNRNVIIFHSLAVLGIQPRNPQEPGQTVDVFINQESRLEEGLWPQQGWLVNIPGAFNRENVHGLARFETGGKIDRNPIQVYCADFGMRRTVCLDDVLDRGMAVRMEQELPATFGGRQELLKTAVKFDLGFGHGIFSHSFLTKKEKKMKKIALFVFNGDPMCFIHVLLNALDMHAKGYEPRVIIEGESVKLIPDLVKPDNPLHGLWQKNLDAGLIQGVCKACSTKLGTLEAAKEQGLTLLDDMSGHPGMAGYRDQGFEIITF